MLLFHSCVCLPEGNKVGVDWKHHQKLKMVFQSDYVSKLTTWIFGCLGCLGVGPIKLLIGVTSAMHVAWHPKNGTAETSTATSQRASQTCDMRKDMKRSIYTLWLFNIAMENQK